MGMESIRATLLTVIPSTRAAILALLGGLLLEIDRMVSSMQCLFRSSAACIDGGRQVATCQQVTLLCLFIAMLDLA